MQTDMIIPSKCGNFLLIEASISWYRNKCYLFISYNLEIQSKNGKIQMPLHDVHSPKSNANPLTRQKHCKRELNSSLNKVVQMLAIYI